MKKNEQLLKTILDSIQSGIIIINAETHEIIDLNAAAERMIKESKEQIIGRICHKFICPVEKGKCPITDLGLKIDQSERLLLTANGEELSILRTVSHITLNGQACLLESFIDITEKKQLEAQLRQSQKMQAIGTLAGGIAHDFNNILTGIFGYAQLIKMNLNDQDKVKKDLKRLIKGAQRASDLVQQILTYSRQTENKKNLLKLSVIVKEAINFLRSSMPANIDIHEKILSRATAMANPTQTYQVIINLCTNAYQAMGDSGGILSVELNDVEITPQSHPTENSYLPGHYIKLEIRDTGHGMDKKTLKRIFAPYFTTKILNSGTGLGLAIVDGIIKEHNGYIKAASKIGCGSTFQVFWPAIEKEASHRFPGKNKTGLSKAKEQIMLVDDEIDILDSLQEILEIQGYKVTTFKEGLSALRAYTEDPYFFDLVITDMTMPNMMGDELSAKILKLRKDMPIILCTGYHENFTEDMACKAGISKYVQKPLTVQELSALIREILDVK